MRQIEMLEQDIPELENCKTILIDELEQERLLMTEIHASISSLKWTIADARKDKEKVAQQLC